MCWRISNMRGRETGGGLVSSYKIWYNMIWYLIHETDFIFCLFTVILFFSVKYYLHNIWVARFQICEVERLNRREWEKLWTRFREKEMLQNICSANKKKQTWRIAMSYLQDLNVKFQNVTLFSWDFGQEKGVLEEESRK